MTQRAGRWRVLRTAAQSPMIGIDMPRHCAYVELRIYPIALRERASWPPANDQAALSGFLPTPALPARPFHSYRDNRVMDGVSREIPINSVEQRAARS